MKRFMEESGRTQGTFLPERLDDYVGEDNPVRAIEAFVELLDLNDLGFPSAEPKATGRPASVPRHRWYWRPMFRASASSACATGRWATTGACA
jgi:hypothetical protein